MRDRLFAENRNLEDDDLQRFAGDIGFNIKGFETCVADDAVKEYVLVDQKISQQFGARGTPSFFINGRFLSGAQPYPAFTRLIDEELKKAKASKIPRGNDYDEAVEKAGRKGL